MRRISNLNGRRAIMLVPGQLALSNLQKRSLPDAVQEDASLRADTQRIV